MNNIWRELAKPFLVLAPMEDVTDTVFRRIVADCAPPDLFFTEFTSAEGLLSKGAKEVGLRLRYTEEERPLIAQIWGTSPDAYKSAARLVKELGFDGVDLNMGCPVDKIVKQGGCSALIKNRDLAVEVIAATLEGAGDLPVSVKTRIGFNKIETEEWCGLLLQQNISALTVHGRLAKDQSKYAADWEEVGKVVKLRDQIAPDTVIVGNGDVLSYEAAMEKVATYGVDGVMIGRGIFQNPWVFSKDIDISTKSPADRVELLGRHLQLYKETWGDEKDFNIMKKFVKMYVQGFEGAAEMRDLMMRSQSYEELESAIEDISID